MMNDCSVIKDLMPLYADGVCSDRSAALVEAHIAECEACRAELETMRREDIAKPDDGKAIDTFRRKLRRKTALRVAIWTVAAAVFTAVLGFVMHGIESTVPYYDGLITVSEPIDGGLDVHVNSRNYKGIRAADVINPDGSYDVYITLYRDIASMICPDNDEYDNFMRFGNGMCVDYSTDAVQFYYSLELPRHIYYVDATRDELTLCDADTFASREKIRIW